MSSREEGPTIEDFIDDLNSQDAEVRESAIRKLGYLGDAAAVKFLLPLLEDGSVRSQVIYSLGLLKDRQAIGPLLSLPKNEVWWIRRDSARALGRIGGPGVFEALSATLTDPSGDVRIQTMLALGELRDIRAIPLLLDLFRKSDYPSIAAQALSSFGDDNRITETIITALQDEDPFIRRCAASAIETGEIDDERVAKPLVALLKDDDPTVREAAARALGHITSQSAVKPLITALSDVVPNVRMYAAIALGNLGDRQAVEPLIETLKTDSSDPAAWAIYALGRLGDQRAVELLLDALAGRFGNAVRHFAAAAVGRLGDGRAFEPLVGALHDEDVVIRIAAAEGLGYLGNKDALPLLERAVENDDASDEFGVTVQETATEAIERIKGH